MSNHGPYDIPNWALPYLLHGDDSGITDEDRAKLGRWITSFRGEIQSFVVAEDEMHFASRPEFGSPCNCTPVTVVVSEADAETEQQKCPGNSGA